MANETRKVRKVPQHGHWHRDGIDAFRDGLGRVAGDEDILSEIQGIKNPQK